MMKDEYFVLLTVQSVFILLNTSNIFSTGFSVNNLLFRCLHSKQCSVGLSRESEVPRVFNLALHYMTKEAHRHELNTVCSCR